jgi:hypothetical protein
MPVSKEQYEFFHGLYEAEERTYEQLENRAKVYLGVITAFVATLLFKANEVAGSARTLGVPWWIVLVEAVILSLALALVLFALRVRGYEAVADGESLLKSFQGDGPTDEEFFEDRMVDYAVASSRNLAENNRTGRVLAWASWLMVSGMVLLIVMVTLALRSST